MLAGVFVAMLHGLRQRQQNGLGLFERIDERFVAQHGAHPRPHHRRMQRLDQKLVGARGDADNLVLHALQVGDHQHRDQLRRPAGFHPAAQLRAAHFRQHQVQNHQVDFFRLQQRGGFGRPMRLEDFVGRGFEDGLQQPAVNFLAIHDQNGGRNLRVVVRFKERNRRDDGR